MRYPEREALIWRAEDQKAYAKWRRAVLLFYAGVGLVILAVIGVYRNIGFSGGMGAKVDVARRHSYLGTAPSDTSAVASAATPAPTESSRP
jgi:hypothetical protein